MRRVVLVSTVVLIALLALGAGYARWFDVLTIDGEVNTGEVIVELTADRAPMIPVGDDKSVATATRVLSDTDNDGYNDQMTITIDGMYPEVTYWIPIDVHSVGAIPAHVKPYWRYDEFDWDPAWFTTFGLHYQSGGTPSPVGWSDYVQLHHDETAYYILAIRPDNDLPEGETFHFTLDIDCGQYNEPNEDPTP